MNFKQFTVIDFWAGYIIVCLIIIGILFYTFRKEYKEKGRLNLSGREIFWYIIAAIGGYFTVVFFILVVLSGCAGWLFEHPWWTEDHTIIPRKKKTKDNTSKPEEVEKSKEDEGTGYATDA